MKHIFTAAAYFLFIFLMSCDNKSDKKEATIFPPSTVTSNPFSTSTDTSTSGLTLNPEHGKPGHRCELAVGAPLNTASTTNSTQPTIVPPSIPAQVQKIAPNPNNSSVTLNPQHGEPGHRCDIAVGSPLSGKPAQ